MSGVWRLVASGDDVFIGASRDTMGVFKLSLHRSGVWVLAATKESGAVFKDQNRRGKQWRRPLAHADGITRGPSILIPHTTQGARSLPTSESTAEIQWFAGPGPGVTVEFSLYFVDAAAPTLWDSDQTVMAERSLKSGSRVVLLASRRPTPPDFNAVVEAIVRDKFVQMRDPAAFTSGSLLWMTESRDALKVPIIVDLPVAIGLEGGAA